MKVFNPYGVEIDFDAAVSMMDDELRERVHAELSDILDIECAEQVFFNAYCNHHMLKFGEEWELAKANPCNDALSPRRVLEIGGEHD